MDFLMYIKTFLIGGLLCLVGQVLMVEVPGIQQFFNVTGLSLTDWVIILVGSSLVLWVHELWHQLTRLLSRA